MANLLKNIVTKLKPPQMSLIRALNSTKLNYTNVPRLAVSHISAINSNVQNNWIYKRETEVKVPFLDNKAISLPNGIFWVPSNTDETRDKKTIIEAPSVEGSDVEKQAVRMIIIRRKKMKKHKLKKLRKKMKFEWAKRRQRRELKKEKLFQAELIAQCKKAETFSAEEYVQEKLDRLNEVVIPRFWKGKRLPEFIIREKMGLPPK